MKIQAMLPRHPILAGHSSKHLTAQRGLTSLTAVMAAGLCAGVLLYLIKRPLFLETLPQVILSARSAFKDAVFAKPFLCTVLSALPYLFCLLLCGCSAFGVWLIYPLLLIKSAGIGALACTYIQNFQMQGIGVFFLTVFPGMCGWFFSLLLMGQNCFYTSKALRTSTVQEGKGNKRSMSLYLMRSLVAFGILLAGIILNTLLSMLLSGVQLTAAG